MIFNILHPIIATIDADSYKQAIKNYIKINHDMYIDRMVIQERNKYYNAMLNYYAKNGQRKVGIDMYPISNIQATLLKNKLNNTNTNTVIAPMYSIPSMIPIISTPPVSPILSTPHVSPILSTPHVGPIVSTPHVGPIISTPHVGPILSTPHVGPILSTPHVGPILSTPHVGPILPIIP